MRKRVLILGATGMLGSAVYGVLKDRYNLILTVRDRSRLDLLWRRYGASDAHVLDFDAERLYESYLEGRGYPGDYLQSFLDEVGSVDYVINAIGITIPSALKNPALTLFINGALPNILARVFGEKLIHITTDCAFNGKEGFPYNEQSPKTPVDLYGLSKVLGEPAGCLVLRTSLVGPPLDDDGDGGLIAWFLKQKGKVIHGFAEHFWNGITTKQFGLICDKIMSNPGKFPRTGLYHIFSNKVSKYDMLVAFKQKFNIDCEIIPNHETKLNRTLSTIYDFNEKLGIPPFSEMIREL
jgi:dTDP-4-dehydrorhamnose reductase